MIKFHINSPRFHAIALMVVLLIGVIIYSNSLNTPFVMDDLPIIKNNPSIRITDLTLESLSRAARKGYGAPRPVTTVSFALNYYFGKNNVTGYHVINILIHLINGVLVYVIALIVIRRLAPGPRRVSSSGDSFSHEPEERIPVPLLALCSALIFTAHPIQTQAVTYVVQRYASMAAMFYMGSLLFYLKARMELEKNRGGSADARDSMNDVEGSPGGGQGFRPLVPICFALSISCGVTAFLCKQNAASLPGVILLVEYLLFDRSRKGWKRKILWLGPVTLLFLAFVLYFSGAFKSGVRFGTLLEDVSGVLRETGSVSRWDYLCTQFNVLVIYIRMLFLPVGQSLDHLYPFKNGFFSDRTPLAFLLLAGLVASAIWNVRKRPILTFSIAWFFITLSVESGIIPISDAMFEHRLYLAMVGFAIFLAHLPLHVPADWKFPAMGALALVILVLATAAHQRNRVWKDEVRLWSDVVAKNPLNYRAHSNLGIALFKEGLQKEAIRRYQRAIEIKPDLAPAHFNLGLASEYNGNLDGAVRHYSEAIRIRPDYRLAHVNLGVVAGRQGRYEEAVRHFSRAIAIRSGYAEVHSNLGMARMHQGKYRAAIRGFRKSIELNADFAEPHFGLGLVEEKQKNFSAAIPHFSKALEVKSDFFPALPRLGNALEMEGNYKEALRVYSRAARLRPNHAEVRYRLGAALLRQGDYKGAAENFSVVLRIDPGHAPALYQMGLELERQGKREEAIKHYLRAVRVYPDYADAQYSLGAAFANQGNLQLAVQHFSEAVRIRPDSSEAHTGLGAALSMRGDLKEAVQHFLLALRIDPNAADAKKNLQFVMGRLSEEGKAPGARGETAP